MKIGCIINKETDEAHKKTFISLSTAVKYEPEYVGFHENAPRCDLFTMMGGSFTYLDFAKTSLKKRYPECKILYIIGGFIYDTMIITEDYAYFDARCTGLDLLNHDIDSKFVNTILRVRPTKFLQPQSDVKEIDAINKNAAGKKIHTIIGQTQFDNSIMYSLGAFSYQPIIEFIRSENKDAFIVFKQHPLFACKNLEVDHIIEKISIRDAIDLSDSCHVISSGAGVEVILADKPLHTYGSSIYSHRGLTVDHIDVFDNVRLKNRLCSREQLINSIYGVFHKSIHGHDKDQMIKRHIEKVENVQK